MVRRPVFPRWYVTGLPVRLPPTNINIATGTAGVNSTSMTQTYPSLWVFAVSLALLATTIIGQSCIGTPPDPPGGAFVNDCNGGITADGGTCTAVCLVGYVGSPTPSATCTAGTWGAVTGSCVAINNCAPLDRPETCAAAGPPCCWSKSSKVCVSCTATGSACCDDGCVSLVYSSLNCGSCGLKCDSKYSCKNSMCVRTVFKP